MTSIERTLLRAMGLGFLYLLASPILLLKLILDIRKQLVTIDRIRGGSIACEWCGTEIALNRVARCAVCSATTPGSLLRCAMCGTTYKTVTCDACQSTVRVR